MFFGFDPPWNWLTSATMGNHFPNKSSMGSDLMLTR